MRSRSGVTFLAAVGVLVSTVSSAGVLDFEGLTTATQGVAIQDASPGYGGFTWSEYFWLIEDMALPSSGFDHGVSSGHYAAYNGWEQPVSVTGDPFHFVGADLTAAWNADLEIRVTGWLEGDLLYDTTIVTDPFGPHWFTFDYLGVDTLVFESSGGTFAGGVGRGAHFALDDFTYEPMSEIPEPTTLLLLGGGLTALALRRRG